MIRSFLVPVRAEELIKELYESLVVVIGSCNMDIVVLADKRPTAGEAIMGIDCTSLGQRGGKPSGGRGSSGAARSLWSAVGEDATMIIDI